MEYLVSYGSSGDFSRFRAVAPMTLKRGDRVVVRSYQGLELGVVLCPVTPDHARFLSEKARGELLRPASAKDEQTAQAMRQRGQRLFDDARQLAAELQLSLEILDVEVLFDGLQAVIHHLRRDDCDIRPFVSGLSRKHDLLIIMQNLVMPAEIAAEEHGCGRPDCGRTEDGGGCGSCGSGGGCATGCGTTSKKEDVTAYLAGLRQQMENRQRTPLI